MDRLTFAWLVFGCGTLHLSDSPETPTGAPSVQEQPLGSTTMSFELNSMSMEEIKANREVLGERLVSDSDPKRRADIAAALGYTAHDELSIPAISHALSVEQDPTVQLRLVAVLLGFRPVEALDAVVLFALGDVDPSIRDDVLSGLQGASPTMVASLLDVHAAQFPEQASVLRETLW